MSDDLPSVWTDTTSLDVVDTAAGLTPDSLNGPLERTCAFLWTITSLAPVLLFASVQWHRVDRWSQTLPQPNWWSFDVNAWDWVPVGILSFVGLIIVFRRMDWFVKASSLFILLAASAIWSSVMMRSYHAIAGTELMVHRADPWHPMTRVSLFDAQVTERGCAHVFGRSVSDTLIFRVRYGPQRGDVVNLGAGVSASGAAEWLKVMQPYVNGTIRFPPSTVADVRHDRRCFDAVAGKLDKDQRAGLLRLLD